MEDLCGPSLPDGWLPFLPCLVVGSDSGHPGFYTKGRRWHAAALFPMHGQSAAGAENPRSVRRPGEIHGPREEEERSLGRLLSHVRMEPSATPPTMAGLSSPGLATEREKAQPRRRGFKGFPLMMKTTRYLIETSARFIFCAGNLGLRVVAVVGRQTSMDLQCHCILFFLCTSSGPGV